MGSPQAPKSRQLSSRLGVLTLPSGTWREPWYTNGIQEPLGSPFLHQRLDPDLEIDTVVVTESDHAMFLQRLESPETGVPSPIARRFVRDPLLFLGYTLDVWQYRLMLIFQVANRDSSRIKTLAVRVPDDAIEGGGVEPAERSTDSDESVAVW